MGKEIAHSTHNRLLYLLVKPQGCQNHKQFLNATHNKENTFADSLSVTLM